MTKQARGLSTGARTDFGSCCLEKCLWESTLHHFDNINYPIGEKGAHHLESPGELFREDLNSEAGYPLHREGYFNYNKHYNALSG